MLMKEKVHIMKAQRLCVVCQENEKRVLLLPCKHQCLCDNCSKKVKICPLCRVHIKQKISAFT